MRKKSAIIGHSVFLLLHLYFIARCIQAIGEMNWATFIFLIIVVLLLYSYMHLFKNKALESGHLFDFIALIVGSLLTFYLNNHLEWGAVIASAAVGTIGGVLPFINPKSDYFKSASPAIYCGTFVGMASTTLFDEAHYIFIASAIAGLFYVFTKGLLIGYGGKLGSVAFSGVLATVLLFMLR